MSAISAASVGVRTMADGTLRLTLDVEPANAKDAFSLFGSPGTPVAIAALKQGYAAKSDEPEQKSPLGPLAKWLVCRCNEPEFWRWLGAEPCNGTDITSEAQASEFVKYYLGLESRKEIDGNPEREADFHSLIRGPYSRWLARRRVLA
jgi:hypothetical protein